MKLDGIVCCVNYDDYLEHSLKHNREFFDNFVIITDRADTATQKIAKYYNAICVIRSSTAPFDANGTKGEAINEGIAALRDVEWLLHLDADIILGHDFRNSLEKELLNPNCLYWVNRKQPATETQLAAFLENKQTIHQWDGVTPEGAPDRWSGPFGYFQLFNVQAKNLANYSKVYPEDITTQEWLEIAKVNPDFSWSQNLQTLTACTDGIFNRRWSRDMKIKLSDAFTVVHLPHGPSRINWGGRKSERFNYPNTRSGFFQ